MKILVLILSLLSSVSWAQDIDHNIILIEDSAQPESAVMVKKSILDEYLGDEYSAELDFSTLIMYNRVGLRVSREFLDGDLDIGIDAGVQVIMASEGMADIDLGVSSKAVIYKSGEHSYFINGGLYRVLASNFNGLDQNSTFNSAKIGIGRKNKKTGMSYGFALHFNKLRDDHSSTDDEYNTIPVFQIQKSLK